MKNSELYHRTVGISIEHAFEYAPKGNSEDDYMFNGLMAVVDALDIIHENTDINITKEIKQKFVKQLA